MSKLTCWKATYKEPEFQNTLLFWNHIATTPQFLATSAVCNKLDMILDAKILKSGNNLNSQYPVTESKVRSHCYWTPLVNLTVLFPLSSKAAWHSEGPKTLFYHSKLGQTYFSKFSVKNLERLFWRGVCVCILAHNSYSIKVVFSIPRFQMTIFGHLGPITCWLDLSVY